MMQAFPSDVLGFQVVPKHSRDGFLKLQLNIGHISHDLITRPVLPSLASHFEGVGRAGSASAVSTLESHFPKTPGKRF